MGTTGFQDGKERKALFQRLQAAILARRPEVSTLLADQHPADIADCLSKLEEDVSRAILIGLETERRADVLTHLADLDEDLVERLVEEIPVQELAQVVEEMDPDDAADLLEVADDEKAEAILDQMETHHADDVRVLRQYDPDTAGGIMTTEYLVAQPDETRQQIVEHLKIESDDIETVQKIFVCDASNRMLGAIASRDLLTAETSQSARSLMDRAVVYVSPGADQEVCVNLMKRYDLEVLPVVDELHSLLGIITHDDILDVLEDEAEEDMFRLVGVGDNKPLEHGTFERAFKRLPWLTTTLVGMGLIGPLILHNFFKSTLDQIVILAFFIPAIMGLSGNTATQSATITVRGLATGEIDFQDLLWMLRRELAVASIIAFVCAIAMMMFAYGVTALGFSSETATFSLARITATVGISMFIGIIVAVLLGTSIPMLCHRAGVDPAVASGPFITTLIDISTQIIYFALATSFLL